MDGVKAVNANNLTHLFVRSQSSHSRVYYSYRDRSSGKWSKFVLIGDDKSSLIYDFDVVVNTFVNVSNNNKPFISLSSPQRVEVFAVLDDGVVKQTWQNSKSST